MASKKIYVNPYTVKGHYRTIHTRTFKFICAHCDKEAQRETYATVCPKYCDECKDIKNKRGTKKQASGEIVETQKIETKISKTSSQSSQKLAKEDTDVPSSLKAPRLQSKHQIDKTTLKSQNSEPKDIPPLDSPKLLEFVNQSFLIYYNKTLNSDSKYVLIDLWDNKNFDQIVSSRNIKLKTLRKITSNLMAQLSNVMGEDVNPRNLHQVMNKHYRAYFISEGSR